MYFFNMSLINQLHAVWCSVGRGNLVLRHSVSHFPSSSGGITCWVAELNVALCLDIRVKIWKYKCKYKVHFLEWGSHPQQRRFYSHTLCPWATTDLYLLKTCIDVYIIKNYNIISYFNRLYYYYQCKSLFSLTFVF